MKTYDVIVAGGGVAGICAAIAARRQGRRVLLVEKQILLGGLATLGRIHWLEPYCDGAGTQILHGLAEELFVRAVRCGYNSLPDDWRTQGRKRMASWFSPENFMLEAARWLQDEGVELLLDARITAVTCAGGWARSVRAHHLSGGETLCAESFVDATGSAQLFFLAGCPCVEGKNYLTLIGDVARMQNIEAAQKAGRPYLVRGRRNYGATMAGKGPEGTTMPRTVRTGWEQTEWILSALALMENALDREAPAGREVLSLPAIPQLRTLRRVAGRATFTGTPGETEPDSIGVIPDFRIPNVLFELPFGSLQSAECENIYAAGRCISAAGEGWEVSRVIGPCCLTGEAAGLAAALGGNLAGVQAALKRGGVLLHGSGG